MHRHLFTLVSYNLVSEEKWTCEEVVEVGRSAPEGSEHCLISIFVALSGGLWRPNLRAHRHNDSAHMASRVKQATRDPQKLCRGYGRGCRGEEMKEAIAR